MHTKNIIKEQTILVVEDDEPIRETIKDILEFKDYNVETASDGKKGYLSIKKNAPDLVICDINMPIMNGFMLLQTLNDDKNLKIVPPFIFLSARGSSDDIRKGMTLGADDYLMKPFKNDELLAIVASKIKKREAIQVHAISKEQNRISAELHDSIQQLLVASQMGLCTINDEINKLDEDTQNVFKNSLSMLQKAIIETRNISHDIANRKGVDLKDKVENILKQIDELGSIKTNFTFNVNNQLTVNHKIELLRIIQEAVNNAVKHSFANAISVHMQSNVSGGSLQITDDGVGFEIHGNKTSYGLDNMKNRAKKIGASCSITSKNKLGTTITVKWTGIAIAKSKD